MTDPPRGFDWSEQKANNLGMGQTGLELQHLKRVSRVKHQILTRYLPSWAKILGSAFNKLYYVDCFAGPGIYESGGEQVDGSPVIAVKVAKEFAASNERKKLGVILVDDDANQIELLKTRIAETEPHTENLKVVTRLADSRTYIPKIIAAIESRKSAPSFFLVDPYGHPLSIPMMNEVLALNRSELLINLMWYQINRDMANPLVQDRITDLFGDDEWKVQPFVSQHGFEREDCFLRYFCGRLKARYVREFRVRFDAQEDRISGNRTKYYLIHASNNLKAVQLMTEVMWPLGDEEGTFDFSGTSQDVLISQTPELSELRAIILREFAGQRIAFEDIRALTWSLPFIEKHYRSVLQQLRASGIVQVSPVTSKGKGLDGRDLITFPKE